MKRIFIFFCLILLLLNGVSAINIEGPEELNQKEIFLFNISGNFYASLTEENIFFYRQNLKIPIEFELKEFQNKYYLSGISDMTPGNYSLVIENVKYFENSQVISEDVKRNFKVTNETADFYLNSALNFVNENFTLELFNNKEEEMEIEIYSELVEENTLTLPGESSAEIFVNIQNAENNSWNSIKIESESTSYSFLSYILKSEKEEELEESFGISPSNFNVLLSTGHPSRKIIYVYNDGNTEISNLEIKISESLKEYLNITSEILKIEPGKSAKIEINISSEAEPKNVSGEIEITSENITKIANININFVDTFIPPEEENRTELAPDPTLTCEEMKGAICESNETCSEHLVHSKSGNCCLGACEPIEDNSSPKVIGWILLALGVVVIAFLYSKYKNAKNPTSLLKVAEGRK